MKILSNFDTRLDSKIFIKKIKKYGDNNVILIKRHPLFLYKAFFNGLISLLLFGGLIYLLYFQYSDNIVFFYTFLILHILGIGIWIFLLLKTIIKHLFHYEEFVTCLKDLKKIDLSQFGTFLKYSLILFGLQFFISILNTVILLEFNNVKTVAFGTITGIFILNSLFLALITRILRRLIDFEMDFIIVTQDEIESFTQMGIFRRKVISLDIKKIRSITTEKNGFIKSLFNIGSLKILSEGDTEHEGEIKFNYIHRLGKLKNEILNLVYKNSERLIDINNGKN